jgi:hypothetical protein
VPFTKLNLISPCLLSTHQTAFCRMEWCLHDIVWILRGPEFHVLSVYGPIEMEVDFVTKSQAVEGGRELLYKLYVLIKLLFMLFVGCSEHLYHLDFVRIQHQIPSQDSVCWCFIQIFSDSKATFHVHEHHCPASRLMCAFPPHLYSCCRC